MLLIIGCPRSGTSLVAKHLSETGFNLTPDIITGSGTATYEKLEDKRFLDAQNDRDIEDLKQYVGQVPAPVVVKIAIHSPFVAENFRQLLDCEVIGVFRDPKLIIGSWTGRQRNASFTKERAEAELHRYWDKMLELDIQLVNCNEDIPGFDPARIHHSTPVSQSLEDKYRIMCERSSRLDVDRLSNEHSRHPASWSISKREVRVKSAA